MSDQVVERVEETVMEASPPTVEPALVQGHDRCDRCGGQAYVKTRNPKGRHSDHEGDTVDLLWCAHHFHRFETDLAPFLVLDERAKLTTPVTSSY